MTYMDRVPAQKEVLRELTIGRGVKLVLLWSVLKRVYKVMLLALTKLILKAMVISTYK